MKTLTRQFEETTLKEEIVIHFSKGLIGFEKMHTYAIVQNEDYEPFRWLMSLERDSTGFPLLNPLLASPAYANELPGRVVKKLFSSDEEIDILCIANLNGPNGSVTINLKSPIIINYTRNTGEQIILPSERLPVAFPID